LGLLQNADAAKSGGRVAGNTRKEIEYKLGRSLVSKENFLKKGPEQKDFPRSNEAAELKR